MNFRILATLLFLSFSIFSNAQQAEDPVLFSVEKDKVLLSEFLYIYEKTNRDNADYSEASINEYLDLYKKFKLKIQKAKDLQLDTIPALKRELAGYRKQLSDSYLIDREVTEKLVKEAYERTLLDKNISHILIKTGKSENDKRIALTKATNIYNKIKGGQDFGQMANEFSDDKATGKNGGKVGFLTALLPNGFYDFETAIYNLKEGEVSEPILSKVGYHIIKLNETRPARGQIEVAHILAKVSAKGKDAIARRKIDSLYTILESGEIAFEDLAKKNSDDFDTASKGGYVGYFGINKFESTFEDAAFKLTKDGEYSKPIKTSAGWHIIKRLNRREIAPFIDSKNRLQSQIKKSERYELAQEAMVETIKKNEGFTLVKPVLDKYVRGLKKEFVGYKWKPNPNKNKIIFSLGKDNFTTGEFEQFLAKNSRQRMVLGRSSSPTEVGLKLFDAYVKATCFQIEEKNLSKKYPEFKALLREYEEGILLFEATKREVWDKASQDSSGLANFYEGIKGTGKYRWRERAEVVEFSAKAKHIKYLKKAKKYAKRKSIDAVLQKINKNEKFISVIRKRYEKNSHQHINKIAWKEGSMTDLIEDNRQKTVSFFKIDKILKPEDKELSEVRGYAIAEYQEFLEKNWVKSLNEEYTVKVNQEVLNSIIKK